MKSKKEELEMMKEKGEDKPLQANTPSGPQHDPALTDYVERKTQGSTVTAQGQSLIP